MELDTEADKGGEHMKFQPNSTFLFTLAGLVILFVIAQSIFFLVRAYRRGKSLGIETAQMKKTILSTQYLPWPGCVHTAGRHHTV